MYTSVSECCLLFCKYLPFLTILRQLF
uniref:Uncharacterized protein n=1 Tax=Anguilla anguilla TaxID=7936 RepID=A0A0E9TS65_ANGAN